MTAPKGSMSMEMGIDTLLEMVRDRDFPSERGSATTAMPERIAEER